MFIEEFRVVAGIAIEEVVGTHAEPEQTDFAVGIGSLVIDTGDLRRGEGTVTTEISKLVQMTQTVEERLVSTTGETADGTVVGIVDGAVVTLI